MVARIVYVRQGKMKMKKKKRKLKWWLSFGRKGRVLLWERQKWPTRKSWEKRKEEEINKQNGNMSNNQRELHLPLSFLFQRFLDFSEEIWGLGASTLSYTRIKE